MLRSLRGLPLLLARLPATALRPQQMASLATRRSDAVEAMEVMIAMSPEDYAAGGGEKGLGFAYAGSYAGRNIEKIYAAGGLRGSLERCVARALDCDHALVASGFFVLHDRGGHDGTARDLAAGSCETDGPLGALAVLRAFAARGKRASLYCDAHNGPVLRAGFAAMVAFYDGAEPAMAAALRTWARCVDAAPASGAEATAAAAARAVAAAWAPETPPRVDCLFAVERLGFPYRNIRGVDISEHTEPIDALWPAAPDAEATPAGDVAALRELAGVAPGALSVGVGDGGNEVGMGAVVHRPELRGLAPEGFAALSENGCARAADVLLAATVSNWGGTAFEAAAAVLDPPRVAYGHHVAVEEAVLDAIMAPPACAVDGKHPALPKSVDGMAWDPYHAAFYGALWDIAER